MEDKTKTFVNVVISVAKIFPSLQDNFLSRKLYEKLSEFVQAYTSHNVKKEDLINSINNTIDLLSYVEHSKCASITPLLYAKRSLYLLKLRLIKNYQKPASLTQNKKDAKGLKEEKIKIHETQIGPNKQKILNFIKHSPNTRTKDIIFEFSALSDRTVKRNLKELKDEGLVKKISRDSGVYYTCG